MNFISEGNLNYSLRFHSSRKEDGQKDVKYHHEGQSNPSENHETNNGNEQENPPASLAEMIFSPYYNGMEKSDAKECRQSDEQSGVVHGLAFFKHSCASRLKSYSPQNR